MFTSTHKLLYIHSLLSPICLSPPPPPPPTFFTTGHGCAVCGETKIAQWSSFWSQFLLHSFGSSSSEMNLKVEHSVSVYIMNRILLNAVSNLLYSSSNQHIFAWNKSCNSSYTKICSISFQALQQSLRVHYPSLVNIVNSNIHKSLPQYSENVVNFRAEHQPSNTNVANFQNRTPAK